MKNSTEITVISQTRTISCSLALLAIIFATGYYWGKKKSVEERIDYEHKTYLAEAVNSSLVTRFIEDCSQNMACQTSETIRDEGLWYAILRSFTVKKGAIEYSKRLQGRGIPTAVIEQDSINKQRKKRVRYQVITNPLPKKRLLSLVDLLKNTDKLTNIDIVEATIEQS
jgi:hypothetical protein